MPSAAADQLRGVHETVNPVKYFLDVDALRIADATAVRVRHIRVDGEDGTGVPLKNGATRIAETGPARASARIERDAQELAAVNELPRDDLAGSMESIAQPCPHGRASAGDLSLHSVPHQIDLLLVREYVR
jgi:hypothetical protein